MEKVSAETVIHAGSIPATSTPKERERRITSSLFLSYKIEALKRHKVYTLFHDREIGYRPAKKLIKNPLLIM